MLNSKPRTLLVSDPPIEQVDDHSLESSSWSDLATRHLRDLDRFDCLVLAGPFFVPLAPEGKRPARGRIGRVSYQLVLDRPFGSRTSGARSAGKGRNTAPAKRKAAPRRNSSPSRAEGETAVVHLAGGVLEVDRVYMDPRIESWAKCKGKSLLVLLPAEAESPEASGVVLAYFGGPGAQVRKAAKPLPNGAGEAWPRALWDAGLSRFVSTAEVSVSAKPRAPGWTLPLLRPLGWPEDSGLCLAGQFHATPFLIVPTSAWSWREHHAGLMAMEARRLETGGSRNEPSGPATPTSNPGVRPSTPSSSPMSPGALAPAVLSVAGWLQSTDPAKLQAFSRTGRHCDCKVEGCKRPDPGKWDFKTDRDARDGVLAIPGLGTAELGRLHCRLLRKLEAAAHKGVHQDTLKEEVVAGMNADPDAAWRKFRKDSTYGPVKWLQGLKREIEKQVHLCGYVSKKVFPHKKSTHSYYFSPHLALR